VAQNNLFVGHQDVYATLGFIMEEFVYEDYSLQELEVYIQLFEDTIAEIPLLSFLADSNSLLTFL